MEDIDNFKTRGWDWDLDKNLDGTDNKNNLSELNDLESEVDFFGSDKFKVITLVLNIISITLFSWLILFR